MAKKRQKDKIGWDTLKALWELYFCGVLLTIAACGSIIDGVFVWIDHEKAKKGKK